jgi:Fur family ferric uptake transcriptional regulator
MTKAREAALVILNSATEPLSASQMLQALPVPCDQATVYRTLRWLEECGRAESFALHCEDHGTERFYVRSAAAHRHWFHCEACHRFIDLGECRIEGLAAELERDLGVSVKRHILYFIGRCADCGSGAGQDGGPPP